jgi:FkbM family methyltransferase
MVTQMTMATPVGELSVRHNFDKEVVKEVIFQRMYERWGGIELKGTIIDCGAHIGTFTRLCASLPAVSNVIAIEPDPDSFKLLELNTKDFKGVILIKAAISNNKKAKLKTNIRPELNKLNRSDKPVRVGSTGIPVRGIRLSDLINKKIDVLKMDIEGLEYEAFENLFISKKINFIEQITIEYHNANKIRTLDWLLANLKDFGFRLLWIGGQDWGHAQFRRM